jgi:hypothetical protein
MHAVANNELIECKNVIISTAFDVIDHLKLIEKTNQIEKICIPAFKNRKREIEEKFGVKSLSLILRVKNKDLTPCRAPFLGEETQLYFKSNYRLCYDRNHF